MAEGEFCFINDETPMRTPFQNSHQESSNYFKIQIQTSSVSPAWHSALYPTHLPSFNMNYFI
ncbi:hypothetical protein E2C01_001487 [Portunus trituberculatus]|uniref:Uncharacterized protein n=1 Tax=Portunus trituberculatus TaxID=210409 RepID=A0A5B7CML3_PORTR|nr:hypothetical protein [Portunus trituberculatus]